MAFYVNLLLFLFQISIAFNSFPRTNLNPSVNTSLILFELSNPVSLGQSANLQFIRNSFYPVLGSTILFIWSSSSIPNFSKIKSDKIVFKVKGINWAYSGSFFSLSTILTNYLGLCFNIFTWNLMISLVSSNETILLEFNFSL